MSSWVNKRQGIINFKIIRYTDKKTNNTIINNIVTLYKSKSFIPRHSRGHKINPTNINFRANIDAMKQLGVTDIISVSAVGSLKENLAPDKFVIIDPNCLMPTNKIVVIPLSAFNCQLPLYRKVAVCIIGMIVFKTIVEFIYCIRAQK